MIQESYLKGIDISGQQIPFRECITASYGVTYQESADGRRQVKAIKIGGMSYQESPVAKSKMSRKDLNVK